VDFVGLRFICLLCTFSIVEMGWGKMSGSVSELMEYRGYYQSTTNIRRLRLLYSLKNRKFIKGYLHGSRTSGDILYRVFPGKYLEFDYSYWNKADPPRQIKVRLVSLSKEGIKTLNQVVIQFYDKDPSGFISQFPRQVVDFFDARPKYYHSKPVLEPLFTTIYTEEEQDALLRLVMSNSEIREGEEVE